MSCEHCQDRLLDLAYGETDSKDEAALRAHVAGCTSCQASYDQLSVARLFAAELPVEEPSLGAMDAILAAARAHVGAVEDPLEARVATTGPEPGDDEGLWATIMRWAGSFAMGPQVAMATIMLLVVSTGLWYFPNRRRSPEATGSTVMSPDLGGEAGPTGSLTPAAPLDLAIDERTGRIRARADIPAGPRQFAQGQAVQEAEGPGAGDGVDRAATEGLAEERDQLAFDQRSPAGNGALERNEGRGAAGGGADGQPAEAYAGGLGAVSAGNRAQAGSIGAGGATGGYAQPNLADDADPEVQPNEAAPSRRMAQSLARPESAADTAPSAARPAATAPSSAPSPAPSPAPAQAQATNAGAPSAGVPPTEPVPADAREAYARGMQRFQRGNYWGAAEDFNRVYRNPEDQQSLVPSALHHMARSHRQANSCRTAVTHYSSLLARYPSYSGAPRAMIELADCYRTLGRLADARTTLERAQRHASVSSEARRELLRVDQMQRAQRRMGDETPAAAAAEAY